MRAKTCWNASIEHTLTVFNPLTQFITPCCTQPATAACYSRRSVPLKEHDCLHMCCVWEEVEGHRLAGPEGDVLRQGGVGCLLLLLLAFGTSDVNCRGRQRRMTHGLGQYSIRCCEMCVLGRRSKGRGTVFGAAGNYTPPIPRAVPQPVPISYSLMI